MTGPKDTDDLAQPDQHDDGKLDNRLEQLDAKLAKIKGDKAAKLLIDQEKGANSNGLALAWRLGSEFVAGVLVGGGVGWLVDTWLGVKPWGLIIFLLLGFLAGMLNMLRSAGKLPPPNA